VQAEALMHVVHFCFSQLTLNAVFVVDKGCFIGMINKADMMRL
jgi:predicted transcriptional regulator